MHPDKAHNVKAGFRPSDGWPAKAGFTLIEAMVACAILVVCLTAMGRTMVTAMRSGAIAERELEAMHTARAALEELVAGGYTAIPLGTHNLANNLGSYTVTQELSSPQASLKRIVMRVNWNPPTGGTNHVFELTTFVSSPLHHFEN